MKFDEDESEHEKTFWDDDSISGRDKYSESEDNSEISSCGLNDTSSFDDHKKVFGSKGNTRDIVDCVMPAIVRRNSETIRPHIKKDDQTRVFDLTIKSGPVYMKYLNTEEDRASSVLEQKKKILEECSSYIESNRASHGKNKDENANCDRCLKRFTFFVSKFMCMVCRCIICTDCKKSSVILKESEMVSCYTMKTTDFCLECYLINELAKSKGYK